MNEQLSATRQLVLTVCGALVPASPSAGVLGLVTGETVVPPCGLPVMLV